jgi:hypothetical protein
MMRVAELWEDSAERPGRDRVSQVSDPVAALASTQSRVFSLIMTEKFTRRVVRSLFDLHLVRFPRAQGHKLL